MLQPAGRDLDLEATREGRAGSRLSYRFYTDKYKYKYKYTNTNTAVQDRQGRGAGPAGGGQHDGDGVGRGDGGDRPTVNRPVEEVIVVFID